MSKFNVSADLLVPVVVEVEADTEDEALEKFDSMSKRELLRLANTEEDAIGINFDDLSVSEGPLEK